VRRVLKGHDGTVHDCCYWPGSNEREVCTVLCVCVVCVCVCVLVCVCTYMHIHMYTHTHTTLCVCVCVCVHTYMYTHTHTHTGVHSVDGQNDALLGRGLRGMRENHRHRILKSSSDSQKFFR
jgi:hypothetical protein